MNENILLIDSSARDQGSMTRKMTQIIANQLLNKYSDNKVIVRNVASGLSFLDEQWVAANFTPAKDRTTAQIERLTFSDELVKELQSAKYIIIGAPIYNFSIPATLKAWVDMIARAGVTFKYTDTGPVGLLANKKVYIAIASGGVKIGTEYDFSSNYLRHIMGFIGITDVEIIDVNKFDLNHPKQIKTII
ncbi:MAG: NAD(P)H-dependent oxidoreductase [Alcanivoracaceae bacterium]|nr:NAD(P)H-dependent oxidoreductase [Alcanivoracaceae bacterium]